MPVVIDFRDSDSSTLHWLLMDSPLHALWLPSLLMKWEMKAHGTITHYPRLCHSGIRGIKTSSVLLATAAIKQVLGEGE